MRRALLYPIIMFLVGCQPVRLAKDQFRDDPVGAKIEWHPTWDLRSLFLTSDKIEQLEQNRACLVEQRVGKKTIRREIAVGAGSSLGQVILMYWGTLYDGQIKVVSRDAITQTSLINFNPAEQQANITVRPGDLVFIEGRI